MNKFPFNEAGFQKLLKELYQLPDEALERQAYALAQDFRSWVNDHFLLSPSQLDFLQKIDDRFIDRAATLTPGFLIKRSPITLIKPESAGAAGDKDGKGKLVDLKKQSDASYSDEGGFDDEESLTYTISYPVNQ
ncbi:hypothetical protein DU508_23160 [Pedobacter chinensis]|uniref:Uncharacterized protein n=1 Tax=Pedobacter chinensis TaxID=2282421 RepID=A0A369PS77_9SPHI|nr:hypothetical protein [Pedobacter chinensis]RDC54135.1 hypothetical protein DU508_23160 [Pedobacter chinensis]